MARATRSSTQHESSSSKKRKRSADSIQLPPAKQFRPEPALADSPINKEYAQKILDVLEMIDTQGLLDRVFPVTEHSTSLSLRSLLEQFNQHPLKVLRSAVQHLFPISSLPRASLSPTALQQLRFCNLALSLLHQASRHTVPVPLSLTSILPTDHEIEQDSPTHPVSRRKYALLQHLPTGDYWTSLNSDAALSTALRDLPTANAELVAILPTPLETSSKHVPSLGSYKPSKPLAPFKPLPPQRRVTTCQFLDYGIWASFAPAFDHDAQVVGPSELGELIYSWEQRRTDRIALWQETREGTGTIEEVLPEPSPPQDLDAQLEELLPPDEVKGIKAALGSLQLENAVQELLERNRRALLRLEELQRLRLMADGGESSTATEGSEEWDTAQGILDSLAVLASLRPRAVPLDPALQDEATSPNSIMPPPSVLHKLHRTLALEPSSGWYGTLPPTRTTALRDDTTIKVRSGMTLPTPTVTTTTTAITATPIPVTIAPVTMTTTSFAGYAYQYGSGTPQPQPAQQQQQQQPYRPSSGTPVQAAATTTYTPYKPPYYQYTPTPQQGVQQQSYYGQQQQGYTAAAYSGWYNAYAGGVNLAVNMNPTTVAASGSGSAGRGTPQPQTQTQTTAVIPTANAGAAPTTYGAFFGGTPPPPAPTGGGPLKTPAVANTVSYAGAQGSGAGAVPTLPIHLRTGQQLQQPLQQGSYYGAYQPPVAR
ncbi:hypothetical protein L208DRAFT_1387642 [Tricholoma matsutake]|nr:hypothetical protein L208DRAFT_1387642 [Tricholoma matsutake 945]